MAKADIQTKQTGASVDDFLRSVADEQQRADSEKVIEMMRRATGEEPKMWGPAIIGFGCTTIKHPSGREVDSPYIGFSPRKGNLTLYVMTGRDGEQDMLDRLGKHTTSKWCLYIKRLTDVDEGVLNDLVKAALEHVKKNPSTC
jgi:hypothetical protein